MEEKSQRQNDRLAEMTADLVAAYVSNNAIPRSELPGLIAQVHQSLSGLGATAPAEEVEPQKPAVNPKRSVHNDYIICLEDGKKFKSLKRHLLNRHGLSPEQYREKWNLPGDYPMVAPAYAAKRSALAKQMGLGRKAQKAVPKKQASRKKSG